MINKNIIMEQVDKHESFYIYDEQGIVENTNRLITDINGVEFLYSIKSNPAIKVVESVFKQGFGADAASLEEVRLARRLGLEADRILYSAPGKSINDLVEAYGLSILIADSINEVHMIQEIAKSRCEVAEIGIRINPDFTFFGDSGIPSKFGIDEDQVFDLLSKWDQFSNVKVIGLHVHSRSQELDHTVLEKYYSRMFELTAAFQDSIGSKLEFVNMGSGLGIPYSSSDSPLDTDLLGKRFSLLKERFNHELSDTRIILETGRYAVGNSGTYVTHVLDKKVSKGTTYVILANTLNGFLRPSIAQLVRAYSGNNPVFGSEPLFTDFDSFSFEAFTEETEYEIVTLVGNLCTSTDIVAKDILMPKLNKGDIVLIPNAGSYAWVLSPIQFSSQKPPVQLYLTSNGDVIDANIIEGQSN